MKKLLLAASVCLCTLVLASGLSAAPVTDVRASLRDNGRDGQLSYPGKHSLQDKREAADLIGKALASPVRARYSG